MSQAGIINSSGMPTVPTSFISDAGVAVPALNVLNIVTPGGGTQGIATSAAGNTITITLTNQLSGQGQTIGAVTADIITLPLGAVPGTYTFNVDVASFEPTTPAGAGYGIVASVRTTGAAAVLIPDQAVDEMEEAVLIPADAAVVVAGNNAIVRVTGVAALTVDWKATATYVFRS